jgi:hypothetical protein
MSKLTFDCGCEFEVLEKSPLRVKYIPKISHTKFDCPKTWAMIQSGQRNVPD